MDQSRFTPDGTATRFVSVSVERTGPCGFHAGLVYRDSKDRLWRLHFAWHHTLSIEPYDDNPVCCVMPHFDEPSDEIWLAKFFDLIAKNPANRRTIPYNLKHDEDVEFDDDTGEIAFGPDSTGLGCATFVLAAFRSGGSRLIDATGWPRASAEDQSRRLRYVNILLDSKSPDRQSQGRRINNEIDSPCISPQHVAGACLEDEIDRPVRFAACEANGVAVVGILDAACP